MPRKKKPRALPVETAEDVMAIDSLQALEADQPYLDDSDYQVRLACFDLFLLCMKTGKPIPSDIAAEYAEKLERLDIKQKGDLLGADLVRAFNLQKPDSRGNYEKFYRDREIAYFNIVLKHTKEKLAERHGLSLSSVEKIVQKYRDYTLKSEKFFPSNK